MKAGFIFRHALVGASKLFLCTSVEWTDSVGEHFIEEVKYSSFDTKVPADRVHFEFFPTVGEKSWSNLRIGAVDHSLHVLEEICTLEDMSGEGYAIFFR